MADLKWFDYTIRRDSGLEHYKDELPAIGKKKIIRLGSLIKNIYQAQIRFLPTNRLNGVVSKKTVARLKKCLTAEDLSVFIIGLHENYPTKLVCYDGNSRAYALMNLWDVNRLTKDQLDEEIFVYHSANPKQSYDHANSNDSHSALSKILNPNYCFGNILEDIFSNFSLKEQKLLRTSKRTPFLARLIAYCHNKGNCGYPTFNVVNNQKKIVSNKTLDLPGSLKVTKEDTDKIIESIRFYNKEVIGAFDLHEDSYFDTITELRKSDKFFSYMIHGRIFKKLTPIMDSLPKACSRNNKLIDALDGLFRYTEEAEKDLDQVFIDMVIRSKKKKT